MCVTCEDVAELATADSHTDANTKRCSRCGVVKGLGEFYKDKSRKDGLRAACKACEAEYRAANAGAIKARQREYHAANKQRHADPSAINRDGTKRCPNCRRVLPKASFSVGRAQADGLQSVCCGCARARRAAYKKERPDLKRARDARRRAVKLCALPTWHWDHDEQAASAALEAEAAELGGVLDHRTPLQSDYVCGLHVSDNLQLLSAEVHNAKYTGGRNGAELVAAVNSAKGAHFWSDMWEYWPHEERPRAPLSMRRELIADELQKRKDRGEKVRQEWIDALRAGIDDMEDDDMDEGDMEDDMDEAA